MADHLERISVCPSALSTEIAEGRATWDRCAELSNYVNALTELVDHVMSPEELAHLQGQLRKASSARALVAEAKTLKREGSRLEEREEHQAKIAEAAGTFRALAGNLRVAV